MKGDRIKKYAIANDKNMKIVNFPAFEDPEDKLRRPGDDKLEMA